MHCVDFDVVVMIRLPYKLEDLILKSLLLASFQSCFHEGWLFNARKESDTRRTRKLGPF